MNVTEVRDSDFKNAFSRNFQFNRRDPKLECRSILKDLFQAMENVTKMLKLMLKNGLLTDDPATSELSTDMDTDENRTDLNKNILKEKKSKTLKSLKSSKS